MRNVMVSGLPQEIHRGAAGAALDIMGVTSPDTDEININGIKGRGSTLYDVMYALEAGGTLEITEKVKGQASREVSLRGVLSAAATMIPAELSAQLPMPTADGPRILQGTVSFDPNRSRTLTERLLGRESQGPDKDLAEKAAADVIEGFRRAFRRSPLAGQLHPRW